MPVLFLQYNKNRHCIIYLKINQFTKKMYANLYQPVNACNSLTSQLLYSQFKVQILTCSVQQDQCIIDMQVSSIGRLTYLYKHRHVGQWCSSSFDLYKYLHSEFQCVSFINTDTQQFSVGVVYHVIKYSFLNHQLNMGDSEYEILKEFYFIVTAL